jgi:hypothetical protein
VSITGFTPAPEAILFDLRIFEESKDLVLVFLVFEVEAVLLTAAVLVVGGGVIVIS